MEILCPLVNQNLIAETPGTMKICCEMIDIKDKITGEPITRKTHTIHQAFHSKEFSEIRENFKKGIRDPHCEKCWRQEDQGTISRRIQELGSTPYQKTTKLRLLTVSLGNTCNIKCRTCGSRDSTFWLKEEYDLNRKEQIISFRDYRNKHTVELKDDQAFYQSFIDETLLELEELAILGGEPFMIPEFWNLINAIIDKKLENQIKLNISTNCTIWDKDKEYLLSKFSNVRLFCSIDGIGPRFEYLRHPAKWDRVEENLKNMIEWKNKSVGRIMTLIPAVSSYNVWYLDEIIKYAETHRLEVFFRPVVTPDHMDIVHIPDYVKQKFQSRLPDLISIHISSRKSDPKKWQEFLESVKTHDSYRSESFHQTFPEYSKIIDFE